MKQDSKELSPRSLDKMLLKLQANSQNVQNTQLLQFIWFSNISKVVQIPYETNWYDSYDFQTCLNLFRFNTIQIFTIDVILKHV